MDFGKVSNTCFVVLIIFGKNGNEGKLGDGHIFLGMVLEMEGYRKVGVFNWIILSRE